MRKLAQLSGKDALSALSVFALGVFGIVEALGYRLGEMRNIGPGAFPLIVSALLLLSAVLIAAEGFASRKREQDIRTDGAPLRVIVFIVAGLLSFALLMPMFGLVPAIFACVILTAFADGSLGLVQVGLLAAAVASFCALVFVVLLNLPLNLLTW